MISTILWNKMKDHLWWWPGILWLQHFLRLFDLDSGVGWRWSFQILVFSWRTWDLRTHPCSDFVRMVYSYETILKPSPGMPRFNITRSNSSHFNTCVSLSMYVQKLSIYSGNPGQTNQLAFSQTLDYIGPKLCFLSPISLTRLCRLCFEISFSPTYYLAMHMLHRNLQLIGASLKR